MLVKCAFRSVISTPGYVRPYTCRLTRLGFDPVRRNTIGFRNNYEIARIIVQEIPLTHSSTLHHSGAPGAIKTRRHNGPFIRFYPPLVNPLYMHVNAYTLITIDVLHPSYDTSLLCIVSYKDIFNHITKYLKIYIYIFPYVSFHLNGKITIKLWRLYLIFVVHALELFVL